MNKYLKHWRTKRKNMENSAPVSSTYWAHLLFILRTFCWKANAVVNYFKSKINKIIENATSAEFIFKMN